MSERRSGGSVAEVAYLAGFSFLKQKTEYEMRISDWSSDVCSSDRVDMPALGRLDAILTAVAPDMRDAEAGARTDDGDRPGFGKRLVGVGQPLEIEIGRASCRERVCQYV